MADRSFTAGDLVSLPRMNAAMAVAVGEAIVRVGKAESDLPASVVSALDKVEQRHKSLADAAASWVAPSGAEATARRAADRNMDAAWSAFHSWAGGWAKLPTSLAEERDKAQELLNDLFENGLKFTQLAWQQEWAESSARLQRIVDKGHEAVVCQLGGEQFLVTLRAAHESYGEALGITAGQPEPEPVPQIRAALESFRAALRTYTLRVAAMQDEDDPTSVTLVTKLLNPLTL